VRAGLAIAAIITATPAAVCADRGDDQQAAPATQPVGSDPIALMAQNGNSLLRATLAAPADPQRANFANVSFIDSPSPVARTVKKHDLVTIIVSEQSAFKSDGTTQLQKNQDFDAAIDAYIKMNLFSNFKIAGVQPSTPPEIKTAMERDFTGTGDVEREDSLTARITAEVLDVKPNGTLVLQARKRIKTDEEEQMFVLSGVCRAEDVQADNTILSTQLYDLQLEKRHRGAVKDTMDRGWVPKLLDVFNPF
jgi:flagellar L-ring protein precursor FlgH